MNEKIINEFPKQSVWSVIGLSIVTLTIYFPFWLRKHTKVVNQLLNNNQIGTWWFPVCLCITIANFGMILPEIITDDNPTVVAVSNLIYKIDLIFTTIWIFKIRNRINIILEAETKPSHWYNAFWTLFFGIFYLQYKTNKLYDLNLNAVEQPNQPDAEKT